MRVSPRNRRLSTLVMALLLGSVNLGCWGGHRRSPEAFDYRHPAVRWVYHAGGTSHLAAWSVSGLVPVPVRVPQQNRIADLQPGRGCVVVTERSGTSAESSLHHVALELEHGLEVFGRPARAVETRIDNSNVAVPASTVRGAPLVACREVGAGLLLHRPAGRAELSLGRFGLPVSRFTRLLAIEPERRPEDWTESTWNALYDPTHALLLEDERLLVLAADGGAVVCVDLGLLPEAALAQPVPAPPASQPVAASQPTSAPGLDDELREILGRSPRYSAWRSERLLETPAPPARPESGDSALEIRPPGAPAGPNRP